MLKTTFGLRYEHLLIKAMSVQPDTDDLSRTERVLSREERNGAPAALLPHPRASSASFPAGRPTLSLACGG